MSAYLGGSTPYVLAPPGLSVNRNSTVSSKAKPLEFVKVMRTLQVEVTSVYLCVLCKMIGSKGLSKMRGLV